MGVNSYTCTGMNWSTTTKRQSIILFFFIVKVDALTVLKNGNSRSNNPWNLRYLTILFGLLTPPLHLHLPSHITWKSSTLTTNHWCFVARFQDTLYFVWFYFVCFFYSKKNMFEGKTFWSLVPRVALVNSWHTRTLEWEPMFTSQLGGKSDWKR